MLVSAPARSAIPAAPAFSMDAGSPDVFAHGDRWFINMGRPGFNSRANNAAGYGSEALARAAMKRYSVSGQPARIDAASVPAPVLRVINVRHRQHRRGLAWSGTLTADGLAVLHFMNEGTGGCLKLDWRPKLDESFRAQIERQLLAMPEAGDGPEAIDDALGFLWDVAICGGDVEEARRLRTEAAK